jgi:A/G-specific adenine glycosylase
MEIAKFRRAVYDHYAKAGRTFPWREKTTPWGVLVSEFMLQQTQTVRAVDYWSRWMKRWPAPENLAAAPLPEVLREWSGLGYNRRARFLRESAVIITKHHSGKVPKTPGALRELPGIGPYCAGAVACFAYNYPAVFIETNIRGALIHSFFPEGGPEKTGIPDSALFPILEKALDRKNPRHWYYALMDYGAALKKTTPNPARRSAHYAKQSPFEGSFRQKRGKLLKSLAFDGPAPIPLLAARTGMEAEELYPVMEALSKESMVACEDEIYRIC